MSTIHQSVPLPLPHRGVMTHISPRYIGSEGLVDAYNVIIRNGRLTTRDGIEALNAVQIQERPLGIHSFTKTADNIITVLGTDDGWHVLNTNFTTTPITGTTLTATTPEHQVVFRTFDLADPKSDSTTNRYVIGVNGKDKSLAWSGSGSATQIQATTPDSDFVIAKCVATCFDRVIYGNVSLPATGTLPAVSYPDGILYTDALKHNNWRRTQIIREASTPGDIISMMEMGNMAVAIYKTDAILMLSAVGQVNAPFRLDLRAANIVGPASPLSVVAIDSAIHVYLAANGDVILFDGSRATSLGEHIQSYMQLTADYEKLKYAFGTYDKYRKELYFFYVPFNGNETTACIMISLANPANPTLWPLRYGKTISAAGTLLLNKTKTIDQLGSVPIDALTGTIDGYGSFSPVLILGEPYAGGSGGYLHSATAYSDGGTAIDFFMRTGWYDLGEFTRYKTVHEINHLFNGDDGADIDIQLAISEYGEEYSVSDKETITIGTTPYVTYHRDDARLIAVLFSGSNSSRIEWLGSEAFVSLRNRR